MKILNRLTMMFFLIVFITIGLFLIAVSIRSVESEPIMNALDSINASTTLRIGVGAVGFLLIVISWASYQFTVARIQRQKNIAFNNPDGQVSISLSAIEEFIRKIGSSLPEVKEMKSDCIATKKGIDISTKVIFWADANIPESTEKIQGLVKAKIQEMLGIDEPIIIKIHVTKIATRPDAKPAAKKGKDKDDVSIPFGGFDYRNE
ncbi:MAG: alkaline shock response membrane anchor protein AmaP [Candidatus Omnitrophica bacterium]|nr:alkaline shock response membrane anchor protein AmaP [Candidatus Omnitrophota bacterium]MDD5545696.1 alkaline shock response membrane anchor protein AmaP [Candidatus Omnitrophota bacterium]